MRANGFVEIICKIELLGIIQAGHFPFKPIHQRAWCANRRPYTERRVHCDLLCQFASHLTMRTGRSNAAQHPGRKCLFRGKITPCERNFAGECAASQKMRKGPIASAAQAS